jgi:hypothetical protein
LELGHVVEDEDDHDCKKHGREEIKISCSTVEEWRMLEERETASSYSKEIEELPWRRISQVLCMCM